MNSRKIRFQWIALLLGIIFSIHAAAQTHPFTEDSLKNIEKRNQGSPWLLIVWATDCPPCFLELELIAEIKRESPDLPIELISMDSKANEKQVQRILDRNNLDSWFYTGSNVSRLQFIIDPEWRGELPRNYFYQADGERHPQSGALTKDAITHWFKQA
ncbi:MAG: hypothetical protein HOE54_07560, partial [Gammaproteobacteria bacterium]|nr:hypothetical protein [Gammaproteobacteria bacterium]